MAIRLDPNLTDFQTSRQQIELIESKEHIHGPQIEIEKLLEIRSITVFTKRYFENEGCRCTQTVSANDEGITSKMFLDGKQTSEATARTFNHARTQAAILTMQDYNYELLKEWLKLHKQDLLRYLSV